MITLQYRSSTVLDKPLRWIAKDEYTGLTGAGECPLSAMTNLAVVLSERSKLLENQITGKG